MFNSDDTAIICIDIQEKLVNMLKNGESIAANCAKLMEAASILNINTIITEQYPKGLGATIEAIKEIRTFETIEKTTFSALQTQEFEEKFQKSDNKNVIIFGIETHICVLQCVIDLIKKGYRVFVVEDCSSSRDEKNHKIALELMKQYGAYVITLETALFNFLKSSKHPNFKEVQQLIK